MARQNRTPTEETVYRLTRSCSPQEFVSLLEKFGGTQRALELMQQALDDQMKCEESGNYLESASDGYYDVCKKQQLLDEELLRPGSAFNVNAKQDVRATDEIRALEEAAVELSARINQLKAAADKKKRGSSA